jgi:hypothetical protein
MYKLRDRGRKLGHEILIPFLVKVELILVERTVEDA